MRENRMTTRLTPESVHVVPHASSKKRVLQILAGLAATQTGLDEIKIFDTLLEREKLGSTGVGRGVAIPHGKMEEVTEIVMMFLKLDKPVEFDSVDDRPADLFFLLLAPLDAGTEHLKALALVSRMMRDRDFCEKLRGAEDSDSLFALLHMPLEKAA